MRTLAQIWLTFMLANIAPSGHVSDLSMLRCNLLFALIQDEISVNVAKIISDEIQKFVDMEVNQERGKRRGALGFPALITALCAAQGIIPDTNAKIRPPINKGYIEKYCVNREEHPDAVQRPPLAPAAPPSPRMKEMEARLMKNFRHIQKQNTSMHRAILHIFQGLFNNIPAGDPNPWMHPEHFADFLNWPGDRPRFAGGDRNNEQREAKDPGVGPSARNAEDMGPKPDPLNEEWETAEDEDDNFSNVDMFFWDD